MKIYMILLGGILSFTACSKEKDSNSIMNCSKGPETFTTDMGTKLVLNTQDWYLEKNDIGGGSVHLKISGSIIGDSATIRTYGDGLINDAKIELDSKNEFSEDLGISFSATSRPNGDTGGNTVILVYNSTDTLKAELTSCTLRY